MPPYNARHANGIIASESFNLKNLSSSNERRIEVGMHKQSRIPSRFIAKIGAAPSYDLVNSVVMNSCRTTNSSK